MRNGIKISEMPQLEFTGQIIDNCFHVNNTNKKVHCISVKDIFNWIKEQSMSDDGLTVENIGDNIIFIKGRKL